MKKTLTDNEARLKLDALERKINAALGTSHTPGARNCHFWSGNQSSGDNGLYRFQNGEEILFTSPTKNGLLDKMQDFYKNGKIDKNH